MQRALPALIFSSLFIGGLCTRNRREIGNLLDDSEEDFILTAQTAAARDPPSSYPSPRENVAQTINPDLAAKDFVNPQVQGLNIGLYFVLQDINRRIAYGQKIPLESLIKVLVLTFKIQNAGGDILAMNKDTLTKVAALYPKPLREAIAYPKKTEN